VGRAQSGHRADTHARIAHTGIRVERGRHKPHASVSRARSTPDKCPRTVRSTAAREPGGAGPRGVWTHLGAAAAPSTQNTALCTVHRQSHVHKRASLCTPPRPADRGINHQYHYSTSRHHRRDACAQSRTVSRPRDWPPPAIIGSGTRESQLNDSAIALWPRRPIHQLRHEE